MSRKFLIILASALAVIAIIVGLLFAFRQQLLAFFFQPTESSIREVATNEKAVETIAQGLTTPWSITFLPNGAMLVTERSGQIQRIGESGKTYPIDGVRETSEGGLLGIAVHPQFRDNTRLYVDFTTDQGGELTNQIDQYVLSGDSLGFERTIMADIPAATNHNGGAIAFGPDGKLYATTGDAARSDLAQDTSSLAGKILRMNDDGSVPADNPYGNLTWSYGHRNPQGIAWDKQGRLWSVEHGPSGADSGRDELNLIEKGANYGWPVITGDETRDGMKTPIVQSGDTETWAPAGLGYYDGSLYFAGLRGQALYRAVISGETVTLSRHLSETYGRLRAVTTHDGKLYVSTSNRDGRGSPAPEDDRILRIDPKQLGE